MPSTTTGGSPPALLAGPGPLSLPAARAAVDGAGFVLRVVDPGRVLALGGRLDVRVSADVRPALAGAAADGAGDLVVDLAELVSVDATGLGVLVGAHRAAGRVGRTLVLRDVPAPVGRLLLLTRLDRVLRQTRTS